MLKFFDTREGIIIVSIILGLGLATLFRQMCKNGKCKVITAPPIAETEKFYYKLNNDCYKYTPHIVPCDNE